MGIREGYLFKKGEGWPGIGLNTGHRERLRWFVLDVERRELSYYKEGPRDSRTSASNGPQRSSLASGQASLVYTPQGDPSAAPALELRAGVIELSKARMIDTAQLSTGEFDIVLQHRIYKLRAANEEEAKRWVATLQPLVH